MYKIPIPSDRMATYRSCICYYLRAVKDCESTAFFTTCSKQIKQTHLILKALNESFQDH